MDKKKKNQSVKFGGWGGGIQSGGITLGSVVVGNICCAILP